MGECISERGGLRTELTLGSRWREGREDRKRNGGGCGALLLIGEVATVGGYVGVA